MCDLRLLQGHRVQPRPRLLLVPVGAAELEHLRRLRRFPGQRVAQVRVERQRRACGAPADGAVHLHGSVEGLRGLCPLQKARTEHGRAEVDEEEEGRQVRHSRAQGLQPLHAANEVASGRAVAGLQALEEEGAGVALGRPIQDAAGLLVLLFALGPVLPQEAADIDGKPDEHERRKWCLNAALLPAHLQLAQSRFPAALEASDPPCSLHGRGRQHRREEVEDAQRQQCRRSHTTSLMAFEVQAVRLQVAQPEPRTEHVPDTLREGTLHDLHHAGNQQAQPPEDCPASPLAIGSQKLIRGPDTLQDRVQLVILQRSQAV
mmetsp:Transcript_102679/g.306685  ORF Transcript_102679/g.306685 Transcript_102679/m.306685 type:complete len:318 (+) Transcript_102679:928-1881(+)